MEEESKPAVKEQKKSGNTKYLAIVGIIIIIVIAGFAYESQHKQKSEVAMTPEKKTVALPSSTKSQTMTYKDGTYTAEGDYITHVGQKHIKVTITLKNDLITASDVVDEADDKMSVRFQDAFIANYKPSVIGKDISSVHLSKIASSSLTPNGFNSALKAIESQAKS